MKKNRGQFLIELLVALALAAVLLPALISAFIAGRQGKAQQRERLSATALAREAVEAVRLVREKSWSLIAVEGTFHPVVSSGSWTLASGTEVINGFSRNIVISNVFRDTAGNIAATGWLDPSTKKVVVTVAWGSPLPSSVVSTFYVTRSLNNQVWVQTTEADFNTGTKTGVVVGNTNGGEVLLGAGGYGDWCRPGSFVLTELDLPKIGKATSVVAIFGEAFAGTGENQAGESLVDILLGNTNPPTASLVGTISNYKTNDIFGEADYAYIATDNNHKEVVIIQVSSLPLTEIGYFNAPGNNFGESLFVANNIGYVVTLDKLFNFDLSGKNGSRTAIDPDGLSLSKEGTSVYVVGNYAYVSIKGDNNVQLDIVDISNPANMIKIGSAKVNNQSAQDVFVNESGTRAYIVTNAASPAEKEFHIVNTENKTQPVKVGFGYHTNGMSPEAVEAVTQNKAIIVGRGGEEYQVVDLTNELSPVRCGGMQSDSGIFDSASILEPDGDAFTYIVTGDAHSEFKVIAGGPGGRFSSSGTFESSTFDAGSSMAFNRFVAGATVPSGTTLTYQFAIADAIGGTCSGVSFSYVGPDGTGATSFVSGSALPLSMSGSYRNPGQCLRYKAFLASGDRTQTPIFNDITINYSP